MKIQIFRLTSDLDRLSSNSIPSVSNSTKRVKASKVMCAALEYPLLQNLAAFTQSYFPFGNHGINNPFAKL
jgi:hypothetical protein